MAPATSARSPPGVPSVKSVSSSPAAHTPLVSAIAHPAALPEVQRGSAAPGGAVDLGWDMRRERHGRPGGVSQRHLAAAG